MRNLSAAELIIGSFTEPAMASSIIGDLAELHQRPLTFWFSVLRTALALMFQEAWRHRFSLAALVPGGLIINELTRSLLWYSFTKAVVHSPARPAFGFAAIALGLFNTFIAPLLTAVVVAKLSRSYQITACLALAAGFAGVGFAELRLTIARLSATHQILPNHFFPATLTSAMLLLVFAILRARSHKRETTLSA